MQHILEAGPIYRELQIGSIYHKAETRPIQHELETKPGFHESEIGLIQHALKTVAVYQELECGSIFHNLKLDSFILYCKLGLYIMNCNMSPFILNLIHIMIWKMDPISINWKLDLFIMIFLSLPMQLTESLILHHISSKYISLIVLLSDPAIFINKIFSSQ